MMNNEKGRSMVEMLGVLAIIGVLSVAGIAGYTMAMNKYKANEIVNAASQLVILARAANQGAGGTVSAGDVSGVKAPAGASAITATCDNTNADCRVAITYTDNNLSSIVSGMTSGNGTWTISG